MPSQTKLRQQARVGRVRAALAGHSLVTGSAADVAAEEDLVSKRDEPRQVDSAPS